jgi:TonB-dependent Receptor Plug Domain
MSWLTGYLALAEGPLSPHGGSGATDAALAGKTSSPVAGGAHAAEKVTAGVRTMVTTTVKVSAAASATDSNEGYERRIGSQEVEQSAGTFGDPSRFMQMLPGVVSDNDQHNDFIVRGGNPAETLFVIDNIQMPSINQLALSDTTGGFVSMIDSAAVQHMTLHTDAYDSKFDQRLSAVLEISTRPEGPVGYHVRSEFGVGGTGGSMERPVGLDGSMFLSVRRSILNLFTDDVGMNGVPIYNNGLVRADGRIDEKNNWWGLSLTGIDSMVIKPSATDSWETNPFDIAYNGWRNTTGINWQHIYSAKAFAVMNASNSEQEQTINQTAQLLDDAQVYYEKSHDGISTVKYDWTFAVKPCLTWTAGAQTSLDRMNYNVQQPIGLPNPYSADPAPGDAMAMGRVFTTSSSAVYSQVAVTLPHGMKIVAGERVAQWAILGSALATPKVVFFAPVFGKMFHAGYAEYAQLPPSLYLLAFANQRSLMPIRSRHLTAGLNLVDSRRVRMTLEGYQKLYSDYPVSANFPQLTMANIADTFGQAFLMFPMTSKGLGVARGGEMAIDVKPMRRLTLSSALTYMRSWYSGLDGVLRKGNFDIPVVANFSGNAVLGKGWTASFRYSGASGKPYTPDSLALSSAQNRDVYDVARMNSLRAPRYSRLDFRAEWTHRMGRGSMAVHVGLDNALGTSNFYSNEWMVNNPNGGTLEQKQMPRFPDGGVRYSY